MTRQTVTLRYSVPVEVTVDVAEERVERVHCDEPLHVRAVFIPGSIGEQHAIEIVREAGLFAGLPHDE